MYLSNIWQTPGALKPDCPLAPQKSPRVLGTRPVGQSLLTCTYLDFWQRHAFLCLCPFFSQWSEEDELADAKQNSEWMDECQDGMFEAWYENSPGRSREAEESKISQRG